MLSSQFTLHILHLFAIVPLLYAAHRARWIQFQPRGNEKMKRLSDYIANGARSFLKAKYTLIFGISLPIAIGLSLLGYFHEASHPFIGVSFLFGALFSSLSGIAGMSIATSSNDRTAEGARTDVTRAFKVAFEGGVVMGMSIVGLALFGVVLMLLIGFNLMADALASSTKRVVLMRLMEILTGFALGGEMVALFARVAGGIYTKAADVGADIVGKTEVGLPEDDPRNPAVIADNVGDNVGDVAGMGADLFGSYISTLLAAMVLGVEGGTGTMLLPLLIGILGVFTSLVAVLIVSYKKVIHNVQRLLDWGNLIATFLTGLFSYLLLKFLSSSFLVGQLPLISIEPMTTLNGTSFTIYTLWLCIAVGLFVGWAVGLLTQYYTASDYRPVQAIIRQSLTGPATNLIAGLSIGMESTLFFVLLFGLAISTTYWLAGFYGVALAASGMMATTGIQLAIDAFGPIADNAGGIAEMSELPQNVRDCTDILDTVGNTTAATGKGFAIASATLTSLGLFNAYKTLLKAGAIEIDNANALAGLLLGGMIPFLFSALTMRAVGEAAMKMVHEVRRQLKTIPGLIEGKASPNYDACIKIATYAALWEMLLPALLCVGTPLCIGFIMGGEVLGSYLVGVLSSGVMLAIFQCNAGGAWDNAKKTFEKNVSIDGVKYGKGSDAHKAAVVGDTVGDPFKDTSGPSMNILIKLTTLVALFAAPFLK